MPSTEWPTVPAFSEMDVWLHRAKEIGMEHARETYEATAEAKAEADAHAAALAAARELEQRIWRAAHPVGRPRVHKIVSKRPWQAAGYATKAAWLADGSPAPVTVTEE